MKVAGFTFVKNAIKYDYPIVEAITSILPLCNEFIVAVGDSEDNTRGLIENIKSSKIKIIDTVWDESLREGGKVLAQETDKAFKHISQDIDWAFYIQGDEVVHEQDHASILEAMQTNLSNKKVDGLLFKYRHFYGSYDYIGASHKWYKNEIRIVRRSLSIQSFRDAQGFRKGQDKMLTVAPINAYINHYGWVKEPKAMQLKQENFNRYWHDNTWINKNVAKVKEYDYLKGISELKEFKGTHPEVMKKRIEKLNWQFNYNPSFTNKSLKEKGKDILRDYFGIDFSYKNYKLYKDQKES